MESLVADLPKDGLEQSSIWNCSCLLVAVRENACIFFIWDLAKCFEFENYQNKLVENYLKRSPQVGTLCEVT